MISVVQICECKQDSSLALIETGQWERLMYLSQKTVKAIQNKA